MFRFTFGLLLGFGASFFVNQAPWEGLGKSEIAQELQLEKFIDKAKEDVFEALKTADLETLLPSSERNNVVKRYYVQLGAFSSERNADRMRAETILEGYTQQTIFVNTVGPGLHRVLIGPFDRKKEAERAIVDTTARGLSGLMIRGAF
jgi:cell division protein FtsN